MLPCLHMLKSSVCSCSHIQKLCVVSVPGGHDTLSLYHKSMLGYTRQHHEDTFRQGLLRGEDQVTEARQVVQASFVLTATWKIRRHRLPKPNPPAATRLSAWRVTAGLYRLNLPQDSKVAC
jgi:hypothetical protein